MALVRKNIRMGEEVAAWYENKAEELGVSQANMMVFALNYYMESTDNLKNINDLYKILTEVSDVSDEVVSESE